MKTMKITEARFETLLTAFAVTFTNPIGANIRVNLEDSMLTFRGEKNVTISLTVSWSSGSASVEDTKAFVGQLAKVTRLVDTINRLRITLDRSEKDLLDEYDKEDEEKSRGLRSTYLGVIMGGLECETIEWVLRNIICDKNGYEMKGETK